MTVSWSPVVVTDIVGSVLTLGLALLCVRQAWMWLSAKPNDIFRHYLFLLTTAFVLFAVSRSAGHLVKQLLHYGGHQDIWLLIAPFSGAVNTVMFVIVSSFSIYFDRQQKTHRAVKRYETGLEQLVEERTGELAESYATLETVFAAANPLCIVGLDYRIIDTNRAYNELWPVQARDGVRLRCYESRPGPSCATDDCPLAQIVGGKDEVIQKTSRETATGERHDFIITTRPFRDVSDKLVGVVESFQDITDYERATSMLAAEQERLKVTLRSLGEGVIATDVAGRLVLINPAAERITGWSQEEARGRALSEVYRTSGGNQSPTFAELLAQTIAGGYGRDPEPKSLVARDGTAKLVAESLAPVRDADSEVRGIVVVLRDVTERHRIDGELARMQKLETVGVLAGGIAHDFNNILTAILGNINLALHMPDVQEPLLELLESAEKATCRARSLTSQLLTFSRGGDPVKKLATVENIVRDSAGFVLHGSNTQCEYRFVDGLWSVEIDTGQISQVVQNIVLNASTAMAGGGNITIEVDNYECLDNDPVMRAGPYVRIRFTDHGTGIDPADRSKIFDPFFTTRPEGTGLGLAVTHSIIMNHRGHIDVASTAGQGTTFTILLPATGLTSPLPQATTAPLSATGSGEVVLIMDDDAMVRDLAGRMLAALGYEVLRARDGQEAISMFTAAQNDPPGVALVILDLTVPGRMGGQDAVQELLKLDPTVRAVVSSGYSSDPIMADFQSYGFRAAISKPYRLTDLQETLAQVLGDADKKSQ